MNPENQNPTLVQSQVSETPIVPPTPKTNWLLPIVFLVIGILIGVGGLWAYQRYVPHSSSQPINYSIPSPTPDVTANWKTYTNQVLGITLKYPIFESPVETFSPVRIGQGIFIVTGILNFDSNKISLCKTYEENLCLIPGKNWGQAKDILPTTLDGKNAISFFVICVFAVG